MENACKSLPSRLGKFHFAALLLLLLSVLLFGGCASPSSGKGIETSVPSEKVLVPEASQFPGVEDSCAKVETLQKEMSSLAAGLTEAETELDGLQVDLDFAREDKASTQEIDELIRNQEEYIDDLNARIKELQQSLAACDAE